MARPAAWSSPSTAPVRNVGAVYLADSPLRRDGTSRVSTASVFFPRVDKHIIDTMARTPYRGSRSVADNLVDTTGTIFARFGRRSLKLPTITPSTVPELFTLVSDLGSLFGPELGISPDEYAFFGERIWQILTSCSERRLEEYEKIGWWEFIGAAQRSEAYQKFLAIGATRSLVASQPKLASTKTVGDLFVQSCSIWPSPASAGTVCSTGQPTTYGSTPGSLPTQTGRGVPAQHPCALDRDGRWRRAGRDRRTRPHSERGPRGLLRGRPADGGHGHDRHRPGHTRRSGLGQHLPAQPEHVPG